MPTAASSKRLVALLTYVGKDMPEMCTLFFRFYTGYHGLIRRDIFVVQSGSSLDSCLRQHRPTILRSDSSEQPFRERRKLAWLQESQHSLLQKYQYVLIADLDEFFLPDPARYTNLPDYLSRRFNSAASPFVAPLGYEIMPMSRTEESLNWSRPVLRQRTRWARLCGMDKPVLTTVPLRYTFGTHSAVALSPSGAVEVESARHKAFACRSRHSDEQLFNLHLKCIDLTAWTEELMDTDRRPKGAAANGSKVSAYAQTRCYRPQPKGINPVPHRLRVF